MEPSGREEPVTVGVADEAALPPGATGRITLTVEEAAGVLGISRSSAYDAVRRGDLPSRRLGRRLIIPAAALYRWLDEPGVLDPPDRTHVE